MQRKQLMLLIRHRHRRQLPALPLLCASGLHTFFTLFTGARLHEHGHTPAMKSNSQQNTKHPMFAINTNRITAAPTLLADCRLHPTTLLAIASRLRCAATQTLALLLVPRSPVLHLAFA